LLELKDYNPDKTIIITGNDIEEYMKVVLKSLEQFEPRNRQKYPAHYPWAGKDEGRNQDELNALGTCSQLAT
jgi:hypothetical protein